MKLFAGFDPREAVGFFAFAQSLIETSPGVSLTALSGAQGDGTNAFTLERFKVFDLCNFGSWACFVDGSDMLLRADIRELFKLQDKRYAVQVVKHDYQTRHERKYVGTEMEADNRSYPRKNWSSVMLVNCAHISHHHNRTAIKEAIAAGDGTFLHRFSWLDDEEIGSLPLEWNWLADEYGENQKAKLLHWTAGIPGFYHYHKAPHAEEWKSAVRKVTRGMQ